MFLQKICKKFLKLTLFGSIRALVTLSYFVVQVMVTGDHGLHSQLARKHATKVSNNIQECVTTLLSTVSVNNVSSPMVTVNVVFVKLLMSHVPWVHVEVSRTFMFVPCILNCCLHSIYYCWTRNVQFLGVLANFQNLTRVGNIRRRISWITYISKIDLNKL